MAEEKKKKKKKVSRESLFDHLFKRPGSMADKKKTKRKEVKDFQDSFTGEKN
jgi:hypothetical protein|tara:strand:+ start:152 stop:307 length:156 start_codon:yes stop_codon:yes gene_type:complete